MKWFYSGDIDLRHGGFFYQIGEFKHEYAPCVEVTPETDIGGRDNVFLVSVGSVSLAKWEECLACIGETVETLPRGAARRHEIVYACKAHKGIEADYSNLIQIGRAEPENHNGTFGEPDRILRANTSLERWIRRNVL